MSKELFDSRSPLLLIPLPPRRAASPSPKLCEVLLDESFNDLGSVKVNRWDPTDSGRPRRCSKCACWLVGPQIRSCAAPASYTCHLWIAMALEL